MNILLVCANGASTGILVEKMKSFVKQHEKLKNREMNIEAISFDSLRKHLESNKVDVVLVGPQIRFKEDEVKDICTPQSIPSAVISALDYGKMDAEAVLKFAIAIYKQNR